MKIGLFAHDVGPHNMLKLVAEAAKAAGHDVLLVPAQAPGAAIGASEDLFKCDILACGISSFHPEEETIPLASLKSFRSNLPVVVLEDVPGASKRDVHGIQHLITSVAVAMPQYVEEALCWGYRRAEFVGVPPHWGRAYQEMIAPVPLNLGGRKIIFFGGIKDPWICNKILASLVSFQKWRSDIEIAFRPHPAEEKNEVATRERAFIVPRGFFFDVSRFSPAELINVAEFSVFTGGATDSIVATFARKPGIFWNTAEVRERNMKQGISDGEWFVPRLKGLLDARDEDTFEFLCDVIVGQEGKILLRSEQEKNFPLPETWDTAPLLVQYLERVREEALATN